MSDELPQLMRQARKSMTLGEYEKAISCYQQVIALDAQLNTLDLQLRLAWCYEQLEQKDAAHIAYEKALLHYQQEEEIASAQMVQKKIESLKPAESVPVVPMAFEQLLESLRAMGELISLSQGEKLCEAGEPSNMLWLLDEGCLGVQLPDYLHDEPDELCAREDTSILVGEIGLFTKQRRSATVWAKEPCRLCAIPISSIEANQEATFQEAMHQWLCRYWVEPILSKHLIFERVNEVERRRLSRMFKPMNVKAGSCLVTHGEDHDGAYLLQQGCLFFFHDHDVQEGEVQSIFPGDLVHLGGLLHGYRGQYEIRTATDVRLLYLSREDFEHFSQRRPWIIQALLRYSRRRTSLQVMRPDDAYLWMTDREIKQRKVSLKGEDEG